MAKSSKSGPSSKLTSKRIDEQLLFYSYSRDVCFLPKDRELSKNLIRPIISDLEQIFNEIRIQADAYITSNFTPNDWEGEPTCYYVHPAAYPLGYCNDICDFVMDEFVSRLTKPSFNSDAYQNVRKLVKEGGILRKVYGIVPSKCKRYFQNEIQIGDVVVDCGVDTVQNEDGDTRKVKIWTEEENLLSPVRNFMDLAEVSEEYHEFEIYPTSLVFPVLAPLQPTFAIGPSDMLRFHFFQGLYYKNISTNFSLAKEFLTNPKYANKKLPKVFRDHLRDIYADAKGVFRFDENFPLDESFSSAKEHVGNFKFSSAKSKKEKWNFYTKLASELHGKGFWLNH